MIRSVNKKVVPSSIARKLNLSVAPGNSFSIPGLHAPPIVATTILNALEDNIDNVSIVQLEFVMQLLNLRHPCFKKLVLRISFAVHSQYKLHWLLFSMIQ